MHCYSKQMCDIYRNLFFYLTQIQHCLQTVHDKRQQNDGFSLFIMTEQIQWEKHDRKYFTYSGQQDNSSHIPLTVTQFLHCEDPSLWLAVRSAQLLSSLS